MKHLCIRTALGAIAMALVGAATAQTTPATPAESPPVDSATGSEFEVGTGLELVSGKYGGSVRVDELSVPLILRQQRGRLGLKLIVPFVHLSGPSGAVPIGQGAVICDDRRSRSGGDKRGRGSGNSGRNDLDDCDDDPATAAQRSTRSGLGDVQIEIAYAVPEPAAAGPALELIGKLKLGTASARKGLGTGKHSGSLQADLSQGFGSFRVLGTLGYRVFQRVDGVALKNAPFGAVGGEWAFDGGATLKLVCDHRRPVEAGARAANEVTLSFERRIGGAWRLEAYVLKGLSDASADLGTGLVIARRF